MHTMLVSITVITTSICLPVVVATAVAGADLAVVAESVAMAAASVVLEDTAVVDGETQTKTVLTICKYV